MNEKTSELPAHEIVLASRKARLLSAELREQVTAAREQCRAAREARERMRLRKWHDWIWGAGEPRGDPALQEAERPQCPACRKAIGVDQSTIRSGLFPVHFDCWLKGAHHDEPDSSPKP